MGLDGLGASGSRENWNGIGQVGVGWGAWGELELLGATWSGVVDWTGMDGVSWGGFGAT